MYMMVNQQYYLPQQPQMIANPVPTQVATPKMQNAAKGTAAAFGASGVSASKKPKGRMSAYTFFVQTCREEHRKKHPNENVNFAEFSKKCAERWKQMTDKEKKRFADMAEKDKQRYEREMASYTPPSGEGVKRKKKKDPNAPKRPLSAFFLFCADERASVKVLHPGYSVGEVAKELGERWNKVPAEVKAKYETKVQQEKQRYEKEMDNYRKGSLPGAGAVAAIDEGDDDDEEEEDDE